MAWVESPQVLDREAAKEGWTLEQLKAEMEKAGEDPNNFTIWHLDIWQPEQYEGEPKDPDLFSFATTLIQGGIDPLNTSPEFIAYVFEQLGVDFRVVKL